MSKKKNPAQIIFILSQNTTITTYLFIIQRLNTFLLNLISVRNPSLSPTLKTYIQKT